VGDALASSEQQLLYEFLAYMLGGRRAGVTVAAQALQHAGRVHYARGRLTILGGDGLEADACECHRVLQNELAHGTALGSG
jgi:hypothetical protein